MLVTLKTKENGRRVAFVEVGRETITLVPHRRDSAFDSIPDGEEVEVMIINGLRNHPKGFLISVVTEEHADCCLTGFYRDGEKVVSKDEETGEEFEIGNFGSLLEIASGSDQELTPIDGYYTTGTNVLRGLDEITENMLQRKYRMYKSY